MNEPCCMRVLNLKMREKLKFHYYLTGTPVRSGFWVGANNVFHPVNNLKWKWLEEKYLLDNPNSENVEELPITRLGWHSYTGNCLAITSLGNDKGEWYLQPVSC